MVIRGREHWLSDIMAFHALRCPPQNRHQMGGLCDTNSIRVVQIPVLILPGKPEFDLLFPNFLVISHLEYLLKIEE